MAVYSITLASGSVFNALGTAFEKNEAAPSTLTVGADGYLITNAAMSNGAKLSGANWLVNVNGAIGNFSTGGTGLLLDGAGATDTVNVGLDGTIFANGDGILTNRNLVLNNKGKIQAFDDDAGVAFDDAAIETKFGTNSAVTIVNSGQILGADFGINLQNNDGLHKITNSGMIAVTGNTGWAILAGTGVDQLSNSGFISGNIGLGNGADKLSNSGTLYGQTFMGDGDDIVSNSGSIDYLNTGGGNDTVTNTGTIDQVDLAEGNDTFIGSAKREIAYDGNGADTIKLGGGNDEYVANFAGNALDLTDKIDGGTGIDTYYIITNNAVFINLDTIAHTSSAGMITANTAYGKDISFDATGTLRVDKVTTFENVSTGTGDDIIHGSAVANVLDGSAGKDFVAGYGGNDTLYGGSGIDDLFGGLGSDTLFGGTEADSLNGDDLAATVGGADQLYGQEGADTLYGGLGKDRLDGGLRDGAADTFVYRSTKESGLTAATRDVIQNFEGSGAAGGDLFDFSAIDADSRAASVNEAFTYIGTNAFTAGTAGQLRVSYTAAGTVIWGETTGDGKADFSILVEGLHQFSATGGEDFVL